MALAPPPRFDTIRQVVEQARRNLAPRLWDYVEGGANGEHSIGLNRTAFDGYYFMPDMLAGIEQPNLSVNFLDRDLAMPVFVAPFGYDGALHPRGYREVARAIAASHVTNVVSESSTDSLEALGDEADGAQGFVQVGLVGPDEHVRSFADRAAEAGYLGICVADVPTPFWRERMREHQLELGTDYGMGNYGPGRADASVLGPESRFSGRQWDWRRLEKLVGSMPHAWIIKGVLTPRDARRAIDLGASAIYVSNYGGRNIDDLAPTLDVLPGIAAEVNGAAPIMVDSGFRRGTDVVKALALGASLVGIGRLAAFGLAAGGEQGVAAVLRLLAAEMVATLGNLGCSSLADLQPRHLAPATPMRAK